MVRSFTILALICAAQLNASAEAVRLNQVPPSARAVIIKYVKNGTIGIIERETINDNVFYDVEFRDANGVKYELVVGEDGRVVQKPIEQ